jgi:hypothetical protein
VVLETARLVNPLQFAALAGLAAESKPRNAVAATIFAQRMVLLLSSHLQDV